jgi:hypothetical protein
MITEITQEQRDLIPLYLKKWTEKVHEPLDEAISRKLIAELYGEETPVAFADSIAHARTMTGGRKEYSVYSSIWWISWLCYYDYALNIGVKLDQEKFERMKTLVQHLPLVVFFDDLIVVIKAPSVIRQEKNRLHSEELPAIEWQDGSGMYYLHGVKFDKELFHKVINPDTPIKEILQIEDVDQRTQALNPKFRKEDDVIRELKGIELDTYQKTSANGVVNYTLYKFPAGEVFTEDAYYCLFDCPSTGKRHLEGVAKSNTVAEAMAWAMSDENLGIVVTPEEWQAMEPLLHEN